MDLLNLLRQEESKVKIKPRGDKVVIRPIEVRDELQTKSGIVIPETVLDSEEHRPQHGIVVALGPGTLNQQGDLVPIRDLKVGDHVVFGKFTGSRVTVDGVSYILAKEAEVLAVLEEGEE